MYPLVFPEIPAVKCVDIASSGVDIASSGVDIASSGKRLRGPIVVLSLVGYVLRRPGGLVAKLIACLDTETEA